MNMEKLTKKEKEFKEVIEQQKEQLVRYEKKLRGKCLYKEKIASKIWPDY